MQKRRNNILAAARKCFSTQGFQKTTIAELSKVARVSAGGIYTHFKNKHEILEAIGSDAASTSSQGSLDLLQLFDDLQSSSGLESAQLDLNLWSEAIRDRGVHSSVTTAMDLFQSNLKKSLPAHKKSQAWCSLVEAIILGLEVQQSLGRTPPDGLRQLLAGVLED